MGLYWGYIEIVEKKMETTVMRFRGLGVWGCKVKDFGFRV